METSASFEARSAPLLYPTDSRGVAGTDRVPSEFRESDK